jgi:catechol 2,3-dioxygenase-like lactoylglutathione lyase family enzyme
MIDHLGFDVADLARSRAFYEQALAPLGMRVIMEVTYAMNPAWAGVGMGEHKPDFWFGTPREGGGLNRVLHVAFRARDRATVDAFHAAAIAAGGRDNGAPGIRALYHPNYYGAFVFDPDGHNIEAVCHEPA